MSKETIYRNVMHHRQYPLDVFTKLLFESITNNHTFFHLMQVLQTPDQFLVQLSEQRPVHHPVHQKDL
jgi:hypothetical protein